MKSKEFLSHKKMVDDLTYLYKVFGSDFTEKEVKIMNQIIERINKGKKPTKKQLQNIDRILKGDVL